MINKLLKSLIKSTISERADKHGWEAGMFSQILKLSPDQRGEIGEALLERLLNDGGVTGVTREGALDRTLKHWDIRTDDMDIEVKTATLGRNANTFQHEHLEHDRNYHAIVLIDIAPNDIYMTWSAKQDIPWRRLHRRATSTGYKWDTKLSELESSKVTSHEDVVVAYNRIKERINP